ncbi:tail fiber assembly protein [Buttiauxella noackiae]|uniref:tail fiber assembly protein n=1 Tax=Buttiauxella noackiae TaxID=82992 RepID=UPI0023529CAD|nr:tail fiber assembly protein [Buttiauxella noackiae]MCA1920983.1 tail fiber assembly protein [Buttiauxella noackiae]
MSELITLKCMTPYQPTQGVEGVPNALFLQSNEGADWYRSQVYFNADTLKVAYRADGVIYDSDHDVSRLVPVGLSVSEVLLENVPANYEQPTVQTVGKWRYVDGRIEAVPEFNVVLAERQRNLLMKSATARITALVEAQEDGDITPEEETELTALRAYRTALRRMDVTKPEWPENPLAK